MQLAMIASNSKNCSRWRRCLAVKAQVQPKFATTELYGLPKHMLTHEDPQMAFDVAREYKLHVDSVKRDRELEEWLEAGFFQP